MNKTKKCIASPGVILVDILRDVIKRCVCSKNRKNKSSVSSDLPRQDLFWAPSVFSWSLRSGSRSACSTCRSATGPGLVYASACFFSVPQHLLLVVIRCDRYLFCLYAEARMRKFNHHHTVMERKWWKKKYVFMWCHLGRQKNLSWGRVLKLEWISLNPFLVEEFKKKSGPREILSYCILISQDEKDHVFSKNTWASFLKQQLLVSK